MEPQNGRNNSYPRSQCTWWADERYHQLTGFYVPWSGNANEWADQAGKYGWSNSSTPTVPSIICLQSGVQLASVPYGHVAAVESINPDGSIVASNLNWGITPAQRSTVHNVTFHPGAGVSFITAAGANVSQANDQANDQANTQNALATLAQEIMKEVGIPDAAISALDTVNSNALTYIGVAIVGAGLLLLVGAFFLFGGA